MPGGGSFKKDILSGLEDGRLTREAGSVGGQMVKKMIEAYEQGLQ